MADDIDITFEEEPIRIEFPEQGVDMELTETTPVGGLGNDGTDGREVELQKSLTHVQWRYVGDMNWLDLVALSELEGPAGADGAAGPQGPAGPAAPVVVAVGDGGEDIDLDGPAPDDVGLVLVWGRSSGNGVYDVSVADGWVLVDPQPTTVIAQALVDGSTFMPVLNSGVWSLYTYTEGDWVALGAVPNLGGNSGQVWGTTGWVTPDSGGPDLSDATPQDLGVAAAGVSTEAARADHVHDMPTAADVGADPAGTAAGLVDDLSGVTNQSQARTNLGLGTAATADTGTGSSNVILGNDARLTDARTPNVGGSNDDFMQRKSGAWTNRTIAQVKADLGVTSNPWTVISEQTLGANAANINYDSLGSYQEFRLLIHGAHTTTGGISVWMRFNSDTTSGRYEWHRMAWYSNAITDNAKNSATTYAEVGIMGGTNLTPGTNPASMVEVMFSQRGSGSLMLSARSSSVIQVGIYTAIHSAMWTQTSALSSIDVLMASGSLASGSYLRLEGRL